MSTQQNSEVRQQPRRRLADVSVGDSIGETTVQVHRSDLVAYANVSGDHNPIHQDEAAAIAVGLPSVIAHGMYTMGVVGTAVSNWCGDPGAVVSYDTKFTGMVPVPDTPEGVGITITGLVAAKDEAAGTVRIDLTVQCGEQKVLGRPRATVRLAS